MLKKWTQRVNLTAEQQNKMTSIIMEYLTDRQTVKTKNGESEFLSEDQKKALSEIHSRYQIAVDTILSEGQKEKEKNRQVKQAVVVTNAIQNIK